MYICPFIFHPSSNQQKHNMYYPLLPPTIFGTHILLPIVFTNIGIPDVPKYLTIFTSIASTTYSRPGLSKSLLVHTLTTPSNQQDSQVEPLAQQLEPDHPEPPHCPYLFAQLGAGTLVGVTTTLVLESDTVDPALDDTEVGVPVGATVPVDVPPPALKTGTDPFHGIH
jgi:hypothetical protein